MLVSKATFESVPLSTIFLNT